MPLTVATIGKGFFNPNAVLKGLAREKRGAFNRAGGYVRKVAKSSLKYGKGSSPRGQPPTVHKSIGHMKSKTVKGVESKQPASPLRELLFYAWDDSTESVVVGPAVFNSARTKPGEVPGKLEDSHPFMIPARDKSKDKIAEFFRGILR